MSDDKDWIDELYAEGAKATPPPELDARIRAAARRPVRHPWYRSPGRLAALATAASLVIAVSVIFLEPEQLDVPAETEALDRQQAVPSADVLFEFEELPAGRREEKKASAARQAPPAPATANEPAERAFKAESALRKSTISEQPAQPPAAAGTRAMEADQVMADEAESPLEEAVVTGSGVGALESEEEAIAELIRRCGALPGSAESRELLRDESGWLVSVTVGADVQSWRCIDGAWIEAISEQQ